MREIPIIFSTPMVQALLAGRKTQTRRIIKDHPATVYNWGKDEGVDGLTHEFRQYHSEDDDRVHGPAWIILNEDGDSEGILGQCRYGKPGDLLYVRESFHGSKCRNNGTHYYFRADNENIRGLEGHKWKPSIHMPKEAARIWLQVKGVRVERLQDISEADAVAEGIQSYTDEISERPRYRDYMADTSGYGDPEHDFPSVGVAVTSFATLWEKINGEESWKANPWLWVVEFEVISTTGKPEVIC